MRVTVVEPGAVDTELTDHITDQQAREGVKRFVADMRPLRSEDIAEQIVHAVTRPAHVSVNEVLVRPTDQER